MKISKFQYISNYQSGLSHLEQIRSVVKGGANWIQYRPKEMSWIEMIEEGKEIAAYCKKSNVVFIMNDSVEAAELLDADGVHLGKTDMKPGKARKILGTQKIIGGTANTFEDIIALRDQGVNYIGLGPYRFTKTKKNLSPVLGIQGYTEIMNKMSDNGLDLPVVAIGGIVEDYIEKILDCRVHGVALSSVISEAKDIAAQTDLIKQILEAR